MEDKEEKMKERLKRGFVDRVKEDLREEEKMMEKIREVYEIYGLEKVEKKIVEYKDEIGKLMKDKESKKEGVLQFKDDDEKWIQMRYEMNEKMERYVEENLEKMKKNYRRYRKGWVLRNEKKGKGSLRKLMKLDEDKVGEKNVQDEEEM